ncbi:RNA-directed DNA polymerase, eukaryota [Tanacetum coccineum]
MKHVGIASWFRQLRNAQADFVSRERIVWVDIEGVPLHVWSRATFSKIGSRWGEVIDLEESSDDSFARKRICIKTSQEDNILERFKIIARGKVFILRAKELFVWSPSFKAAKEADYCSDEDVNKDATNNIEDDGNYVNGDAESDVECVSDTVFADQEDTLGHVSPRKWQSAEKEGLSSHVMEDDQLINAHDSPELPQSQEARDGWETKLDVLSDMAVKTLWGNHRFPGDRMGTVFNVQGANEFNCFISNSGLTEVQLEGYSFTWSHPSAKKMSKLDRFFVTDGLLSLFPHISAVCLDRNLSDHRPILLREVVVDYGPSAFRLRDIDIELDKGGSDDDILLARMDLLKKLNDIQSAEARDRLQKAKIQWAIEGDENSKFFHGIINRKRANLAVKGVMVNGEWLNEPCHVKEEFRLHFANRFSAPSPNRCKLNFVFPNKLSPDLANDLERPITRAEVRNAVWGCGENKSPGPDGFTFEFFRKYWDILGSDFCAAIEWFFEHCMFARGCNSSFIALIPKTQDPKFVSDFRPISLIGSLYKVVTKILANRLLLVISDLISDVQTAFLPNRQILDGPFIINELLSWCKHKKQQAMVFKVDFAKAYDSVRWDFLDDVLAAFGFGSKWRLWIRGSLYSGMASVLLNGSPSLEFEFHRGLKQGDPLAPYLFILIMESFHLSISRAVDAGIFRGINISDDLNISHLFYADDAVFIGKWNELNLSVIFLESGVPFESVNNAAAIIGCSTMRTPFKYLGVMVGDNTSKVHAWDDIVKGSSIWNSILKEVSLLKDHGIDLLSHCQIRVGNGLRTQFWNEIWIAGTPLRDLFPRIYALETLKGCSVASKLLNPINLSLRRDVRDGVESYQLALLEETIGSTILSNMEDRWTWDLNSDRVFRVKDMRNLLDDHFLPKVATATRWVKFVLIKINIFAWKLYLDRLPTRSNLLLQTLLDLFVVGGM